tara:strand:- start:56836 stop:57345 length:510 start_codon:yes stop_codon:yes gene_type:complete
MASELDPRLLEAIEKNSSWIEKRCRFSEFIPSRCEELVQDTMYELIKSNESFVKNDVISPKAWVKRVVSNTLLTYSRNEAFKIKEESFEHLEKAQYDSKLDTPIEVQEAFSFLKKNSSARDQEIMHLHFMGEPHKEIATIVGMKSTSVTNTISKLNSKISEHLNRGLHE